MVKVKTKRIKAIEGESGLKIKKIISKEEGGNGGEGNGGKVKLKKRKEMMMMTMMMNGQEEDAQNQKKNDNEQKDEEEKKNASGKKRKKKETESEMNGNTEEHTAGRAGDDDDGDGDTKSETEKKAMKKKKKEAAADTDDKKKKKKTKKPQDDAATDKDTEDEAKEKKEKKDELSEHGLSEHTVKSLKGKGITSLFAIQRECLGAAMEGRDVTGRARTGSGKTLAFALPVVEVLAKKGGSAMRPARGRAPRALVLAPTRELAKQVASEVEWLGKAHGLVVTCLYGGAPYQPQEAALARGVDVVVGTPGRVKDMMHKTRLDLSSLLFRVLDEADEMLNMGFKDDVEEILSAVKDKERVQTLLFSATMPRWVAQISKQFQRQNKLEVDLVAGNETRASSTVRQCLITCDWSAVQGITADLISVYNPTGRTIVFCETKRDCGDLSTFLAKRHSAVALHGDILQSQREVTMKGFRDFKYNVLVATDVAARGLDIDGIELVIQVEPPKDVESFIHRSGRTGRAGREGMSVLLCGPRKAPLVTMIERSAKLKFDRISAPQPNDLAAASAAEACKKVRAVRPAVAALFTDQARKLLEDEQSKGGDGNDAIAALAAAIACIAGHGDIAARSMLTSREGYTTVAFKANAHVRSASYVFSALRRILGEAGTEQVHRMTLRKDGYGAVFDMPCAQADALLNDAGARAGFVPCDELPELVVKPTTPNGGGGGGRGGYGRGGGFGGGARGRGGWRGAGGGGGGGGGGFARGRGRGR